MATLASTNLKRFASDWEAGIDSARKRHDAATLSGIVGDLAHRKRGGYHISREDQPKTNYSVILPADRRGASNLAAAVDMNMDPEDMILVFGRLYRAWENNDPRLRCCRGINGTLDGKRAIRIDCQTGVRETASADHLWHLHLEILRMFADDPQALAGVLSVILGTPASTTTYAAPARPRTERDRAVHADLKAGDKTQFTAGTVYGGEGGLYIFATDGDADVAIAQWDTDFNNGAGGWSYGGTDTKPLHFRDGDGPAEVLRIADFTGRAVKIENRGPGLVAVDFHPVQPFSVRT